MNNSEMIADILREIYDTSADIDLSNAPDGTAVEIYLSAKCIRAAWAIIEEGQDAIA